MNRTHTLTQKVSYGETALRASVYIHVDHLDGRVDAIRLSEPGKDNSTLDFLFTALGDALTDIVREVQR
jgi:hypothetical protein|tara:strand:+ start:1173 stop:1379 length:207 start_codon:yes stop_codon:yes gene_type:complete